MIYAKKIVAMNLLSLLISIGAVAAESSTASAPVKSDQLIVPGVSLGKITLGMTRARVHELLLTPSKTETDCDEYRSKGGKNTLYIWFTPQQTVYEIMFSSPSFRTADGISLKNCDAHYDKFNLSRLKWRFLNMRYLLKQGGFAIYDLNADSPVENADYPHSKLGVVYKGKMPPKPALSIEDPDGKSGWRSWDGKSDLYEGLDEPGPGAIGSDLNPR